MENKIIDSSLFNEKTFKNELKKSQEELGWKTERSERQIDDFLKRCSKKG